MNPNEHQEGPDGGTCVVAMVVAGFALSALIAVALILWALL